MKTKTTILIALILISINSIEALDSPVVDGYTIVPSIFGITPAYLRLNWTDYNSDKDGFRIYKQEGAGEYDVIAVVPPIMTFYNDLDYNHNITTSYKVEVFKSEGGGDCGPCVDIDGNSYETVQIGDQCWMAENLKVTHYRDGTPIPTGTYCAYNNDTSYVDTYGWLYNGSVVTDSSGLAPFGWHVPNNTEWQALATYLGGISLAGGKMKEAGLEHWASPNMGATNESGFTALPGGCRVYDLHYYFRNLTTVGYFWSSSAYHIGGRSWEIRLYSDRESITFIDAWNGTAYSVRCIKD